jgi:flagellin-like protein
MKTFRKLSRRAISPLIATIMLIAICVAGGLLVYTIFFSTAGTISAKGQLTVEAIDLVKQTDGAVAFTITIKNSGNKPISAPTSYLNVTLKGTEYEVPLPSGGLQPGQSTSFIQNFDAAHAGVFTIGNTYTVTIKAKFDDGSTFTTTTSVQCRSG